MTTDAPIELAEGEITATPLRDALHAAIEAAEGAQAAFDDSEEDPGRLLVLASVAADDAVETIRAALRASAEPRSFTARDDAGSEEEIEATSGKDARRQAREWVRGGDWNIEDSYIYVDVRIEGEDGTDDAFTVAIGPEEPDCEEGKNHDWQSPIEIVGGIAENPGVWGHGGGVTINECCMHCGCKRHTDTWAQRRDTGEQGLREVTYEVGFYAEEIAKLRAERTVTVYIDQDATTLGPAATQADLDRYAQNLADHLAEKFPGHGQIEVEQVSAPGTACPDDEEIDERVRELHAGDGWVELLRESDDEVSRE